MELAIWVQAIATVLLAIIALFQDQIRTWLNRPRLELSIEMRSPDSVKIPTKVNGGGFDAYYCRLRVTNAGKGKADFVQVFAYGLSKKQLNGTFQPVGNFLPMSLRWAGIETPTPYLRAIFPGIHAHCDLLHIIEPEQRKNYLLEDTTWPNVPTDKAILSFATIVLPNTKSYLHPPGEYYLDVTVVAANVKPHKKRVIINFTGDWFDHEGEMFSDGITIQVQ